MFLEEVEKSAFAQINDKRYYFSDVIVSLSFSHPCLSEIIDYKEKKKQRIENYILEDKQKLMEEKCPVGTQRSLYSEIF